MTEPSDGARVLVIGPRRSGTTWTELVLGRAPDTLILDEPETGSLHPHAVRAFDFTDPWVIEPGDEPSRDVLDLWDGAFDLLPYERSFPRRVANRVSVRLFHSVPEARRHQVAFGRWRPARVAVAARLAQPQMVWRSRRRNRIVKSVVSQLAVEWLLERYRPTVVVCRRHPMRTLASMLELGRRPQFSHYPPGLADLVRGRWGVPPPPVDADPVAHLAWDLGFRISALRDVAAAHPEIVVVHHEDLLTDPVAGFAALTARVGLTWGERGEAWLLGSNTEGVGYTPFRRWDDQRRPWQERLDPETAATARSVLERFPLAADYPDLSS